MLQLRPGTLLDALRNSPVIQVGAVKAGCREEKESEWVLSGGVRFMEPWQVERGQIHSDMTGIEWRAKADTVVQRRCRAVLQSGNCR